MVIAKQESKTRKDGSFFSPSSVTPWSCDLPGTTDPGFQRRFESNAVNPVSILGEMSPAVAQG